MKGTYDGTIGYSPLDRVDPVRLQQVVRINRTIIESYHSPKRGDIILVAGAGGGHEAALVRREFGLRTVGVDLNVDASGRPADLVGLELQKQDLMSLGFRSNSFWLAYCYHVLEHVADHAAVLAEIHRVLKPAGVLFLGFPNRNRLVSYFGASQKASLNEKVSWNLRDYAYRLAGRFENRRGAHAGFAQRAFLDEARSLFSAVWPVRDHYMLLKYPAYGPLLQLIIKIGLSEVVFPSNYYICKKGRGML